MSSGHSRVAVGRKGLACLLMLCLVAMGLAVAVSGCAPAPGRQASPAPGGPAAGGSTTPSPGGSSGPATPGKPASGGTSGSDSSSSPNLDLLRRLTKPFEQMPASSASQPSPFRSGQTLDDFSLPDVDGHAGSLNRVLASTTRGTVLSFVTPDSPACRKDLLQLAGSYGELRSQGLDVLVVVACAAPEEARAYAQSLALHMTVLVDVDGQLGRRLGVTSLPLHIIVRPDHLVWKSALGWAVTDEGTVGLNTDLLDYLKGPGG